MLKPFNKNLANFIFYVFLAALAAACFQKNFLHFADPAVFSDFQRDSEILAVGAVVADKFGMDKRGANLGGVKRDNDGYYGYQLLGRDRIEQDATFSPYKSQYGLQGLALSKISKLFGFSELAQLQSIVSFLLALVVVGLFAFYRKIYDIRFAVIFLITLLSSPWIVAFARNLYWVPFTWFLPALLAAAMYLEKRTAVRQLLLLGIATAVFAKSLSGYEYLSTITLFTCSAFIVGPFFKDSDRDISGNLKWAFLVFMACIIGFLFALLLHASMRGDTILSGLQSILEQDVKRRTYGDPALFGPVYKESLESSPFSVVAGYVINWHTAMVAWVPGRLFKYLGAFVAVGLLYKIYTRQITWRRDIVLLAFFFTVPVSWFVLAKGHSYIHAHLNYVLWYFGFLQALIYVALDSILVCCSDLFKLTKTVRAKSL